MTDFVKMDGLGNTFIVFLGPQILANDKIAKLCEQNQVDGLLVVSPINDNSVQMKYWNADGSVAEMCGNGLRCVTRFAVDNKMISPGKFTVQTDVGPLKVKWDGKDSDEIEVQVGKARIEPEPAKLHDKSFYIVNVGNPHAVTFVDDTETTPVEDFGPKVENDSLFPNKTNVEFVQMRDKHNIRVRVWERGVGETKACGTGMVAAANVAVDVKNAEFPIDVEVPGGSAKVWLDDEGYTRMLGPAQYLHSV